MDQPATPKDGLVQVNARMPNVLRRAIHVRAAQVGASREAVITTILADALGVPLPADLRADGVSPTPATQPTSCNCPAPCPK